MPRRAGAFATELAAPSDVGERIRQARQREGLSLAQLGGAELTRGFLSAVENGRSSISLKSLSLVAHRLGLPLSYFLDETAAQSEALPELLLDDAETALMARRPSDALRLVNEAGSVTNGSRSRQLWLRGWALRELGRAREALPVLREAMLLAEAGGDLRHLVLVEYTLAMALASATNYDESLVYLRRAHNHVATELLDDALLGKITVALGHLQYMQGHFDEALGQYARARELFGNINDQDNLAAVYSGLSRVHRQRGDLKAALRYSRLTLGILSARQNEREAARELSNIAARYLELGDTEEALTSAHNALQRAEKSGAPDVEGLARSTLAAAYLAAGRTDDARAQADRVRELGLPEGDQGQIDVLIVLAKLAEQNGDGEQADSLYERALAALEENGYHARYAEVALAYSEALNARGNTQDAFTFARMAARALTNRPA